LLLECEAVQNQYEDKNGNKVSSVEFVVKNFEFCESKKETQDNAPATPKTSEDGWMNIPDGVDSELPFM
jgi:single-strand DNA-binding protein